jgi:hypothetical protein
MLSNWKPQELPSIPQPARPTVVPDRGIHLLTASISTLPQLWMLCQEPLVVFHSSHIHTYTHTRTRTHTHTHIHMHTHKYMCAHTYKRPNTIALTRAHTHTHIHSRTHTCMHACTRCARDGLCQILSVASDAPSLVFLHLAKHTDKKHWHLLKLVDCLNPY